MVMILMSAEGIYHQTWSERSPERRRSLYPAIPERGPFAGLQPPSQSVSLGLDGLDELSMCLLLLNASPLKMIPQLSGYLLATHGDLVQARGLLERGHRTLVTQKAPTVNWCSANTLGACACSLQGSTQKVHQHHRC